MLLGDSSFLASQCLRITCKMGPRQRHKPYAKVDISHSFLNDSEKGYTCSAASYDLEVIWRSASMLIAKTIQKEKRSEVTMGLVFTETEVLCPGGEVKQENLVSDMLIRVLPLPWKDYRDNLSKFSPLLKP